MRTSSLIALAAVVTACQPLTCTEMGCIGSLTLTVQADGAPVAYFAGTVTVGDESFDVSCNPDNLSDGVVTCGDGVVSIQVAGDDMDGVAVVYAFTGEDGGDTGGHSYEGSGTLTPAWSKSAPNGAACGPICWGAEGAIDLEVVE